MDIREEKAKCSFCKVFKDPKVLFLLTNNSIICRSCVPQTIDELKAIRNIGEWTKKD